MGNDSASHPLEIYFATALAIFAALLALNELGAGKYGEDELKLSNEKTGAYLWYQSKGIKESVAEGQRDILATLLDGGLVDTSREKKLRDQFTDTVEKVARYKKEKREILLGSKKVGKENWVQDVDGEMGKVVGAKEYEEKGEKLSLAGDRFDAATLFLQISLVLGALGLVMKVEATKKWFLRGTLTLGTIGVAWSIAGYLTAWGV